MTMAAHLWPVDPRTVSDQFNQRHGPAVALPESFLWAVWAAEESDYLEKLDATHPGGDVPNVSPTGAHPDLVDISHVRWATGNAITAIDLCAATIGRLFCGITGPPELDLRYFHRNTNRRRPDTSRWRRLRDANRKGSADSHQAGRRWTQGRSGRPCRQRSSIGWTPHARTRSTGSCTTRGTRLRTPGSRGGPIGVTRSRRIGLSSQCRAGDGQ